MSIRFTVKVSGKKSKHVRYEDLIDPDCSSKADINTGDKYVFEAASSTGDTAFGHVRFEAAVNTGAAPKYKRLPQYDFPMDGATYTIADDDLA